MPTEGQQHQQHQPQHRRASSSNNNANKNAFDADESNANEGTTTAAGAVANGRRRQSAVRAAAAAAAAATVAAVDSGAGVSVADAEAALDLDVVLLQMSKKFNNDLDVRAAEAATTSSIMPAAARPAGSSNSPTTASYNSGGKSSSAAEHRIDRTMKWRGLLKNKFAASAARRSGNVTSAVAAAGAVAVPSGRKRRRFSIKCTAPKPLKTDRGVRMEKTPAATASDAEEDSASAAVVEKPQLRVLRRHAQATTSQVLSTNALPQQQQQPCSSRSSRTKTGHLQSETEAAAKCTPPAASPIIQSAAATADTAPTIRRKGRPKRNSYLSAGSADAVPDKPSVEPNVFEPKALRSRRSVAVVPATTLAAAAPVADTAAVELRIETPANDAEKIKSDKEENEEVSVVLVDEKDEHNETEPKRETDLIVAEMQTDVLAFEMENRNEDDEIFVKSESVQSDCMIAKPEEKCIDDCNSARCDDEKDASALAEDKLTCAESNEDGGSELIAKDDVKTEENNDANNATDALQPSPKAPEQPATTATSDQRIPKKRGRKPGYRKPLHGVQTVAVPKKTTRHSRDNDPAFDPSSASSSPPSSSLLRQHVGQQPAAQRLSRRIKPTAKILANDELRYGFELQNNARLSLSNEHLDATSASSLHPVPSFDDSAVFGAATTNPSTSRPMPIAMMSSTVTPSCGQPMSSHANASSTAVSQYNGCNAAMPPPPQPSTTCPDPVAFLLAIKMAKINLHRSPENDIRGLSVKQKRRLFKRKEKHLNKLGLQRRRTLSGVDTKGDGREKHTDGARTNGGYADGHDEDDDGDEEDFVPNQKITVGRPSVTLRLRANTQTGFDATAAAAVGNCASSASSMAGSASAFGQQSSSSSSLKRTYAVVKSSNETSLILSTKHNKPTTPSPAAHNPTTAGTAQPSPTSITTLPTAIKTICECGQPSNYYTHRTLDTLHCRAVDEIAGQRIGCCNLAATTTTTTSTSSASPSAAAQNGSGPIAKSNVNADVVLINLRRPSVRVAYTILCSAHVQRLQAHHSCAGCGVFCTHGRFAMCSQRHLFHRDCATKFILSGPPASPSSSSVLSSAVTAAAAFVRPQLVLRCPHCGSDANDSETTITMSLRNETAGNGVLDGVGTLPVFVPDQRRLAKVPKMSIGAHTYASAAAAAAAAATSRSSSSGNGGNGSGGSRSFMWELEKLIPAHIQDVVLRAERVEEATQRNAAGPPLVFSSKDMCSAIYNDDLERAVKMIASGFDIGTTLPEMRRGTCLHLVANFGSLAMAYLILCRAPPSVEFLNRRDRELRTALMCAVLGAKNDTARMLVQCGADVTARGPGGMTALHLAAKTGNFAAAQLILESHRRATTVHRFAQFVNAVDDGGWTTIVWAAEIGHAEMVEYLVRCGADLSVCDAERNTVLHWAALSDDVATVRPLLAAADLNVQNVNGDTPLHIACRNSNTRMCLFFLAHGASLDLQNDLGEMAFDGIQDVHGACARAVEFNMKLRTIARFEAPTVICQDISNGREAYPIKVLKRLPTDGGRSASYTKTMNSVPQFQYITQSIVLHDLRLQIDRRISQMRICECIDSCTSASCRCSQISVQNWYNAEGRLNGNFDFTDPAMIFECSDVCGCNKLLCRNRVVQRGQTVALQLVECGGRKGWGVTAVGDVARGTFVAEYCGELLSGAEAAGRSNAEYMFETQDDSQHCIDASRYGNISRFFNHSCEPNVLPIRVYCDHQDLRFPKIAFFAMRDIGADEEITFDYGEKFWLNRGAQLRCECRTARCRFGRHR